MYFWWTLTEDINNTSLYCCEEHVYTAPGMKTSQGFLTILVIHNINIISIWQGGHWISEKWKYLPKVTQLMSAKLKSDKGKKWVSVKGGRGHLYDLRIQCPNIIRIDIWPYSGFIILFSLFCYGWIRRNFQVLLEICSFYHIASYFLCSK